MKKKPLTISVAAVITRGKRVLVTRRSPENRHYKGYWEFPGGKIQAGETPEMAVKREIKEELGVSVTLSKNRYFSYISLRDRRILLLTVGCKMANGTLVPGPMISETAWCLPTVLRKLKMIPSDNAVRDWFLGR